MTMTVFLFLINDMKYEIYSSLFLLNQCLCYNIIGNIFKYIKYPTQFAKCIYFRI